MKQHLLLLVSLLTLSSLIGQSNITHVDFGEGWVIPMNENAAVDMDDNGSIDFYINSVQNEIGFTPIFGLGCFTSPEETAQTPFGSRELMLHNEGDLIQLTGDNIYNYIDDDRGSGYSVTGGLASGWNDNEDVFVGVALIIPGSYDMTLHNAWIRLAIDVDNKTMIIKEWAYSDLQTVNDEGILAGDTGSITNAANVQSLNNLQISPNPASDQVTLMFDYSGAKDLQISILNAIGQEVYRNTSSILNGESKININTEEWIDGIYWVRFRSENKSTTEQLKISR